MKNMPVPVSKETLIAVLEDMLEHVRHDDSFEGSLEYLMPMPAEDHNPVDVEVRTSTVDGMMLHWCGRCGVGCESVAELERVHQGDPRTTADGQPTSFMLQASYRIGNSMGQGGLRMIGELK